MHQGIKTYLDGSAFLAPLDNPRAILDIGYALGITSYFSKYMQA